MTINIDELVKVRTGETLEVELRKNADFLLKQQEWREAIKKFDDMISTSSEQWLSLQSVEDIFLEYNSSYGEVAYRLGYSDGVMIGVEQELDGKKSVLSFEDMTNLISVYDAIRQLKKVLLGRMDERWEDAGAFSEFERVFNVIINASFAKIKFLGDDKAIKIITEILSDETLKPEEKARRLLGIEQ